MVENGSQDMYHEMFVAVLVLNIFVFLKNNLWKIVFKNNLWKIAAQGNSASFFCCETETVVARVPASEHLMSQLPVISYNCLFLHLLVLTSEHILISHWPCAFCILSLVFLFYSWVAAQSWPTQSLMSDNHILIWSWGIWCLDKFAKIGSQVRYLTFLSTQLSYLLLKQMRIDSTLCFIDTWQWMFQFGSESRHSPKCLLYEDLEIGIVDFELGWSKLVDLVKYVTKTPLPAITNVYYSPYSFPLRS